MIYKIEDVLEDIKNGIFLIIVDDENRENEGDFFVVVEKVIYESINFMVIFVRGLICIFMISEYVIRLGLDLMIVRNIDVKCIVFIVFVDVKEGIIIGILIVDRFIIIKKLVNKNFVLLDFIKFGYIFLLIVKDKGVLEREGYIEVIVDLCKICGFIFVFVICEILKDDGIMVRMDDLEIFVKEYNLKIIIIVDLIKYRKKIE